MKKLFIYTIMCFLYITLTATTCDDIDYRTVCIRNNTSQIPWKLDNRLKSLCLVVNNNQNDTLSEKYQ